MYNWNMLIVLGSWPPKQKNKLKATILEPKDLNTWPPLHDSDSLYFPQAESTVAQDPLDLMMIDPS